MRGPRIAWIIAGACLLLAVFDTALVAVSSGLLTTESIGIHGWPLVNVAALGSAGLGALILGSQPRHPIGWLLNLVGLTTSISLLTETYSLWVSKHDGIGSTTQADLAGWVAAILGGPLALTCLTLTFLVVPAGSFLSPRWRWVARGSLSGFAAYATGLVLVGPHGINRSGDPIEAGPVAETFLSVGITVITLTLLASVGCMLLRHRRSDDVTRQQLRLVATGAGSVGLALVALLVGQGFNGGRQTSWSSIPLYASYAFLILCIALAVLRYRLYGVEVIIRRALVLAIATALVAASYVGVVVALGRTLEHRTHAGFWLSLLATVVVALAFQPVRRAVVRVADRLAYGDRAAPYEALTDFSRRIGHSPAPGQLLPTIAAAAGEAVHAVRVVVQLVGDNDGGLELTATWPPDAGPSDASSVSTGGDVAVVPVRDRSGVLGSITLTLPPGRDVRPQEHRLLSEIAEQAALALRNGRLQIELAARVRQLDQRTSELKASRSRIIGADDAERRRLEDEIGRRVLPTMRHLRVDLEGSTKEPIQTERIEDLVGRATQALESLRDLTRGVYPTILSRSGLGPALTSFAARMQRLDAVQIDARVAAARFQARVENTAYFCCVEVLEHDAGVITLGLSDDGRELVVTIHGVTLDALNQLAVVDRVEACEGSLEVGGPDHPGPLQLRLPAGVAAVSTSSTR